MVQCTNCGSEVQADAKFCRECGQSLVPVPQPEKPAPKKRRLRWLWIALGILGGLLVLCVVLVLVIPSPDESSETPTAQVAKVATATPAPTSTTGPTPTSAPTNTPTPVPTAPACTDILASKGKLTDVQWDALKNGLDGQWVVDWEGKINEVGDRSILAGGYPVHIDITRNCALYYAVKDEEEATKFSKGQVVVITGEISLASEIFGSLTLHLHNDTVSFSQERAAQVGPTATPIGLGYREFHKNHQEMTDLQKEQYKSAVIGTRVHWTAKVEEIDEKGRIKLSGLDDYPFMWIYLDGVPTDKAAGMSKGQSIEFEATVRETGTGLLDVGFAVYLDNAVLISPE